MSCSTCKGLVAVTCCPLGLYIQCPDCEPVFAEFPAELPPEDEIWNTSQQKIYVRNLKKFVSLENWEQQLLDLGTDYDDFTCAKCYLADKCRSAFDSYNTNGDCLEEK